MIRDGVYLDKDNDIVIKLKGRGTYREFAKGSADNLDGYETLWSFDTEDINFLKRLSLPIEFVLGELT